MQPWTACRILVVSEKFSTDPVQREISSRSAEARASAARHAGSASALSTLTVLCSAPESALCAAGPAPLPRLHRSGPAGRRSLPTLKRFARHLTSALPGWGARVQNLHDQALRSNSRTPTGTEESLEFRFRIVKLKRLGFRGLDLGLGTWDLIC